MSLIRVLVSNADGRSKRGGGDRSQVGKYWANLFTHDSMVIYFNEIPPETHQEICELEIKVGDERQSLSDSELLEDMLVWVWDPMHTKERRKKYLNLVVLHQKMKVLLGLVLRDKKVEKYNIFASLENMKRMLRNLRFGVEELDAPLMNVESHIVCDLDGGEKLDPLALVQAFQLIFPPQTMNNEHVQWVATFGFLLKLLVLSSRGLLLVFNSMDGGNIVRLWMRVSEVCLWLLVSVFEFFYCTFGYKCMVLREFYEFCGQMASHWANDDVPSSSQLMVLFSYSLVSLLSWCI